MSLQRISWNIHGSMKPSSWILNHLCFKPCTASRWPNRFKSTAVLELGHFQKSLGSTTRGIGQCFPDCSRGSFRSGGLSQQKPLNSRGIILQGVYNLYQLFTYYQLIIINLYSLFQTWMFLGLSNALTYFGYFWLCYFFRLPFVFWNKTIVWMNIQHIA